MRDFTWSPAEKKFARTAFDLAYARECDAVLLAVREMLKAADDSQVIWRIEEYLAKRRREMESRHDYRYSVLLLAFAGMIRDRLLLEEDLAGLASEKIDWIRQVLDH